MKMLKKTFILLLILLFITYSYSIFIEPKRFKTNEISFKDEIEDSYNGLKIVHFGDIYYDKDSYKMLKKIKEEIKLINPDIIIFTGDLINDKLKKEEIESLTKFFNSLQSKYGKYAILGDNDYKDLDNVELIYKSSDFILLDNKYDLIFNNKGKKILIGGVSSNDFNFDEINNYLTENKDKYYKIILSHKPDYTDEILNLNKDINLVLSGHSLLGSINISHLKIDVEGAKNYNKDHYKINKTNLYITNGIGTSSTKMRLNNVPSINFYRINK